MNKKILFSILVTLLILTAYSCSEEDSLNDSSSSSNSSSSNSSSSTSNQEYFCLTISSTTIKQPKMLHTDNNNNIYLAGAFEGTVDFDPGESVDNHTSNGNSDIFITKIDANGAYRWTKTFGNSAPDTPRGMALDSSGNIYITGGFSDTVDFDPGTGIDNHTSSDGSDIYITKINANGSYGWTKTIRGQYAQTTYGIALDNAGNIYITGKFNHTTDFNPNAGIDNHSPKGYSAIFITKLHANGTYGWTKTINANNSHSIAVSSTGNIYITGYFNGSVDFNPDAGEDIHTVSSHTAFITKILANGTYSWTKAIAGLTTCDLSSIKLDSTDNIYITGLFSGIVDFNPETGEDIHTAHGDADIFITKILANGTYGWTKSFGGPEHDGGNDIAVDNDSNIYISGIVKFAFDFNLESGAGNHRSYSRSYISITKLYANGVYGWTKIIGGATYNNASRIAINVAGELCIIGSFNQTVLFDWGSGSTNYTSIGANDIFIMKMPCN